MVKNMNYSTRFVCYAHSNGHTPDEEAELLGEYIGKFTSWLSIMWDKWDKLNNNNNEFHCRDADEHKKFDIWLKQEVGLK